MKNLIYLSGVLLLWASACSAQQNAPKPLYDDPVFHSAADPVLIYNKQEEKWWMFYTNRRASTEDSTVRWVHGARIGIAESSDGSSWTNVDTSNIRYRPDAGYTHWAPDVIKDRGIYHIYLTYVPGVFTDWNHPRAIIHLTSPDLKNWDYQSTLNLVNEKEIEAPVYKVNDSLWKLWYNNERDDKSIWFAESRDLYYRTDKGRPLQRVVKDPTYFYDRVSLL